MIKIKSIIAPGASYDQTPPLNGTIRFSLVGDECDQLMVFNHCRESTTTYLAQKLVTIKSGELTKTRVLIGRTDQPDLESHLQQSLEQIHLVEKSFGLIKSTIEEVEGLPPQQGKIFLIEGSKRWHLSSPMFSLYLLLIRDAGYPNFIASHPDVTKMIEWLKEEKYWKIFGKDSLTNWQPILAPVGGTYGLQAFLNKYHANFFPHWKFPSTGV